VSIYNSTGYFFEKHIRAVQNNFTVLYYLLSHYSINRLLIPFLFAFFIISFLNPSFGHIFSFFVAALCLIIPLLKRPIDLPILFIILFISNVFDPTILFVQSPFHFGILEFINPSQLFCVGATIRVCFDILLKLCRIGKISYLHTAYLLLLAFSIVTSFYGVQADNERKLQTLMFLFNISGYLWFYESFLNLDQRNIRNLIRLLKVLGVASLILYAFNFPNTHISFLFLALSVMTVYMMVKSKSWYWYLLIPFAVYIVIQAFFYLSVTTVMIAAFAIMIGVLSLKKTFFTSGTVNLIILITISSQAVIFAMPFIDLSAVFALYEDSIHTYYDNTKPLLERILFKFTNDRMPLWMGAIRDIQDNLYISASGTSFRPLDFGTFATPVRRIDWVAGAHQLQLELMLNYGLIGAVIYWIIWLSLMKKLFSAIFSKNLIIKFLSVSLLAYFIPTSFVANFMIQEHALAAWLLMGVTIALHKRDLYFNKKCGVGGYQNE